MQRHTWVVCLVLFISKTSYFQPVEIFSNFFTFKKRFLTEIVTIFTIYAHTKLNIPRYKQLNVATYRTSSCHIILRHICFSTDFVFVIMQGMTSCEALFDMKFVFIFSTTFSEKFPSGWIQQYIIINFGMSLIKVPVFTFCNFGRWQKFIENYTGKKTQG